MASDTYSFGSLFLTQEKMAVMDEIEQEEERLVNLAAILLRIKVKGPISNQTNIVLVFSSPTSFLEFT